MVLMAHSHRFALVHFRTAAPKINPQELVSVFVESHFDDEEGITMPVLDMLLNDPMLKVQRDKEK